MTKPQPSDDAMTTATSPQGSADRSSLPLPEPEFTGSIGRSASDSVPAFPKPVAPPKGAPNVILILLDDVGFGHPSAFGGPVSMPTLDRLAARGLRYNRFHTTAMCSPTRAALLTGRNHHAVANGSVTNLPSGFPGYNSVWPRTCASLAEVLRGNGYATAAFGKWHNTPEWETGPAGPFDRWPTGLGFEYFYGFQGAECSQWDPTLTENTRPYLRPEGGADGLHLDQDLADRAIAWMRLQKAANPDRPFFMYYATGSAHTPHHAPKEWIERYRGHFDHGWDRQREMTFQRQRELGIIPPDAELTPRPANIPAWQDMSPDERKLGARLMEAFAGALSHCDHQIGRVLDELQALDVDENTMVIYIAGDNGPSGEGTPLGYAQKWGYQNGMPQTVAQQLERIDEIGGPDSYSNYPVGWAWAGSAPLQWLKQIASHFGGTRNGMVMSWPRRIADAGGLRSQFHHCVDIVPTILEAASLPVPRSVNGVGQREMDGTSMHYTFDDPGAASRRKTQYFELLGNRAIYHDGWVAGARHGKRMPWEFAGGAGADFDADEWELYHVDVDFSQARNLASSHPGKLRELQQLWIEEAKRCNVFPLDGRYGERYVLERSPQTHFEYFPGAFGIPERTAPNLKGRSHRITADLTLAAGTEGIVVTAGGRFGGYALYVQGGRLHYVHNVCGLERHRVVSGILPAGRVQAGMTFVLDENKPGAGGTVSFHIGSEAAGSGRVAKTVPVKFSNCETFDVGLDTGSPVDDGYRCPFAFTGELHRVVIDILDDLCAEDRRREQEALEQVRRDSE